MTLRQFFCFHDWVVFRKAVEEHRSDNRFTHGWGYCYLYEGRVVAFTNYATGPYRDRVCSKCNKLDLSMTNLLNKKNAKHTALEERRNKAKEWALKYISLRETANRCSK